MVKAFLPDGGEDLQRTYKRADGSMTHGGNFVPMFQDAASFHLGIVAQLTGYGASLAEIGGSAVAIFSRSSSSNNDRNMHSIAFGAAYIQSHIHELPILCRQWSRLTMNSPLPTKTWKDRFTRAACWNRRIKRASFTLCRGRRSRG